MFEKSKDRYLTRSVDAEIPIALQVMMWQAGCRSDARTKRLLAGVSAQREERFADRASYLRAATV